RVHPLGYPGGRSEPTYPAYVGQPVSRLAVHSACGAHVVAVEGVRGEGRHAHHPHPVRKVARPACDETPYSRTVVCCSVCSVVVESFIGTLLVLGGCPGLVLADGPGRCCVRTQAVRGRCSSLRREGQSPSSPGPAQWSAARGR